MKTNNINITIGRHIDFVRRSKKISREQLASKISVTKWQLQNYERGRDRVSLAMLHEIAVALEVNIIDLIPIELKGT